MVGLPFANVGSMELQERMRYVERLGGKDAGKELYEVCALLNVALTTEPLYASRQPVDWPCDPARQRLCVHPAARPKVRLGQDQEQATKVDWRWGHSPERVGRRCSLRRGILPRKAGRMRREQGLLP